MGKLNYADEEYYITADYLLQLCNRAYELFQSSEVQEKRQLLKLALQNLTLKGSLVQYDLIKPFDKIFNYASHQRWLAKLDTYRTYDWLDSNESGEILQAQSSQLLSVI